MPGKKKKQPVESVLTEKTTGMAIREYLLKFGEASPNDFYREFRKIKPSTSYNSVRRYFYILKNLGLIRQVGVKPGRAPIPKSIYKMVPGMERSEYWSAPQIAMYPITGYGSRRYKKLRTQKKKR
ncbi:MAG: hypothetical protein QXI12_05170 [Candidatus Methanomethyliaceae archaeon]